MKGSVTRPIGGMTERESLEAFCEGAKKAASAARELAMECQDAHWEGYAVLLDSLRQGGMQLSEMRSMSRLETLMAASIKANPAGVLN
jgi:hypothetical protein